MQPNDKDLSVQRAALEALMNQKGAAGVKNLENPGRRRVPPITSFFV
jgi:hypothetical protein